MTASYQHYATHDESEFPHLWRGVAGAWAPCLGPSGTRLHDHGGRANWGTLTNMDAATDWVVDSGQYALDFDGSNDHVLASRIFLPSSASVSLWMLSRANTNGARLFCNRSDGATGGGFDIYIDASDNIGLYLGNSGAQTSTPGNSLPLNSWNHILVACSPAGARIFINGRLSGSSASNFTIASGTSNLFLGRFSFAASSFFNGLLDDIFVFGSRLTENDVAELYQTGRGGMYTPRRRRRAYFGPLFQAGWARGSNVLLQPCGVS